MLYWISTQPTKDTWWVYLLGAVIGGGGIWKAFAQLQAVVESSKLRKESRKVQANHVGVMRQGWVLEDLVEHTRAGRAVLLYTHNGDGKVRPGSPIYSSVFDERCADGVPRIRDRWNGQELDGEYRDLVGRLAWSDPYIRIQTERMKACDLRNLYETDKVVGSKVIRLGFTPKRMYYLSLNFFGPDSFPASPQERDTIRACVQRLQRLFEATEPGWQAGINPSNGEAAEY